MTNEELVMQIQSGCNVRENMGLLYEQNESLIEQYIKPLSAYCDIDDLKQEAFFGIHKAIEKYDFSSGYKFMTYAKAWIIKSAIRYVDNNGTVKRMPAHMKQRIRAIKTFCEKYKMMNGKTPTDNEICSGTGLKQSQLDNARKADAESKMKSIYEPMTGGSGEDLFVDFIPDDKDTIQDTVDSLANNQAAKVLWGCVDTLPELRRDVVRKRFINEMTYKDIGSERKLSGEYIRQVEGKALKALQNMRQIKELQTAYNVMPHYKSGISSFNRSWTSSTEKAAMRRVELEQKIKDEVYRRVSADPDIKAAYESDDPRIRRYAELAVLYGVSLNQVINIMNNRKKYTSYNPI